MTEAAPRNRRRARRGVVWATIGAAMVVHVAFLGTTSALGFTFLSSAAMTASVKAAPDKELAELESNCIADAYLAEVGRLAMCAAPWSQDREQCAYDANMQMYLDMSSCQAVAEPEPTQVAMVKLPRQTEKLPQIDPEKLVDEGEQLAKQEPPKPVDLAVKPPAPPPPPPPPAPAKPVQIVETAKPDKEAPEPDDAHYLSEYNTVADKQKVNRGARNEPMVAKAKPEELKPSEQKKDEPSVKDVKDLPPGKNDGPPAPGSMAMRTPGSPQKEQVAPQDERVRGSVGGAKGPSVADGYVAKKGDGAIEQQRREREEQKVGPRGQDGGGGGAPPVVNLKPSKEQLERALGGGNVDRVEDANEDDETSLTSKRFVFASFFNRLKRQVAQNWEPAGVWHRLDPQGTVYGFKTRITEVRVVLAPNGVLDKILVTQASGVGELDDEAVRAFKAAAPFPNPPDGLVKDGRITFAFSFYFEIGQPRSSWKVIRSM